MKLTSIFSRRVEPEYFRVSPAPRDEHSFAIHSEIRAEGQEHAYAWFRGKPIAAAVPEPVVFRRDRKDELRDILLTNASQVLVSGRAKIAIVAASTCARPYAAEIREEEHVLATDYWVINLECSFACMDLRKSGFRRMKESERILSVHRLVLDRTRIPSDQQLFRLTEYLSFLICTRDFKEKVESLGLTGFRFAPVEVA